MNRKVEPPSIRPKLALTRRLIAVAALVLAASHPAVALDSVSLQLKWKHQFQFAGYYQALEQGFYRDAGLDVTIREGGPDIDVSARLPAQGGFRGLQLAFCVVESGPTAGRAGRHIPAFAAVILVASGRHQQRMADLRGRTLMDAGKR
jgi:ABC-type nitrate/sulfonate/bicarbonate transport system substrate-binding protein